MVSDPMFENVLARNTKADGILPEVGISYLDQMYSTSISVFITQSLPGSLGCTTQYVSDRVRPDPFRTSFCRVFRASFFLDAKNAQKLLQKVEKSQPKQKN